MRVFTVFKYDYADKCGTSIGVFSSLKKAVEAAHEEIALDEKFGVYAVEYSICKDILDKETRMAQDWLMLYDAETMLLDHEGSEYAKLWLEEGD